MAQLKRTTPPVGILIVAEAGVRSIFRSHKERKHQPHSYNTPRLDKLKEERRKAPTGDGISQIHSDSLPWYKVVELVRTEDLLDLFFYFCLVRM